MDKTPLGANTRECEKQMQEQLATFGPTTPTHNNMKNKTMRIRNELLKAASCQSH